MGISDPRACSRALGFQALATTSAGFAFTLGRLDGEATLDEVIAHVAALDRATGPPRSVDIKNGYSAEPREAATAVLKVANAGAVGGSIEDYDQGAGIYDINRAAERIGAAAEAAATVGVPVHADGARGEPHPRQPGRCRHDQARLQAYAQGRGGRPLRAGAQERADEIRAVCECDSSKPVNVLARADLSFAEMVEAGARRVSVGGALTWVAVQAATEAARSIADGDFSRLNAVLPLNTWFAV